MSAVFLKSRKKCIGMSAVRRAALWMLAAAMVVSFVSPASYALGEFDERVPELFARPISTENPKVIQSSPKIRRLMNDVYYSDIDRVTGKREIVRMTAVGVLNPRGEREYRPADAVTGFEMFDALLGLIDSRDAIIAEVQEDVGILTPADRLRQMYQHALYRDAETRGMLQSNELLGLGEPLSRERAALFLGRALGVQGSAEPSQSYVFDDWRQTETYARPIVDALAKNGIVTLRSAGFAPKENLTRSEMAIWLDRAFDQNLALTESQIGYGVVVGVKETVDQDGSDEIITRTVILSDQDGAPVYLVSTEKNGLQVEDYITYRAGNISTSRQLAIGDEIEYITVDGFLRYAGLIDNGQILLKLIEEDPYTFVHYGVVMDSRTVKVDEGGGSVTTKEIYRVRDITGDVFDIVVFVDGKSGIREDIVTIKAGVVGGVRLMKAGDTIQYTTNELRQVGYIKVGEVEKKYVTGTVHTVERGEGLEPTYVTIYDYSGELRKFRVEPTAVYGINGRSAKLDDFVYGIAVTAYVVDGGIISLRGESFGSEAGYIPLFGKMRIGTVVNKSGNSFTIRKQNGETEMIVANGRTFVTKSGLPAGMINLKNGEKVKVYFDYITGNIASRVEIEAFEQPYDKIYKGRLLNIVAQNRKLQLTGSPGSNTPEVVASSKWSQSGSYGRDILIDPQCEIYMGNEKLAVEDLERMYRGYVVYAVTNEVFGRETAVKLSVCKGDEMLQSSAVRSVNHTFGEFDLLTKDNFGITKATILLKDGLLVPVGELRSRDTVLVASEFSGGKKNAMFVSAVSGVESSPEIVRRLLSSVRIGAIETVSPTSVTLRNYTMMTGYAFEKVRSTESPAYHLSTASDIKDITDEDNIKSLSANVLFHDKYARVENASKTSGLKYKRYYAFMAINPESNVIVAMKLRKSALMSRSPIDTKLKNESDIPAALDKNLKDAVITKGIVTSNDTDWDRIELTEVYDFVKLTNRWSALDTNIFVKYSDAIVVKGDRSIGVDEINMGDSVYIVRIGTDSLFIFVE